MLKKTNLALLLGTSSWREQFKEAVTVSTGDDEDEDAQPSYGDYVMHYITLFWKILFAFVPPTDMNGGWACFVVAISMIGILTAVTGDLASHFGCTVGLADSVVAISFVALGTSLPDTFASKVAAINDETADASVGNVQGSNAVNVFLGIGVAWSLAAIYHTAKGSQFVVQGGSLGFSVLLFCILAITCLDTFASKVAALNDETADASVGNVQGSNAVNVFLGIGVAWSVASIYHTAKGSQFEVKGGSLGFSVLVFCCLALVCLFTMMWRRFNKNIGAELGGPQPLFTNCILVKSPREDGHHSLPSKDSVTADPRDADSDLSLKMVFLGREVCVVKTYVCAT
eukprot:gene2690-897_t